MSLAENIYVAKPMITPTQVIDFMDGLVLGLTQKEDLKEITACLSHATDLAYQITDAVSDFEKKDIEDIIKGIGKIGEIIQEVPQDFQDCKSMQGDLQRIEAWGKIFEDPVKLAQVVGQNVIAHFSNIMTDINKIPTDFTDAKYKDAGEDIADLMVQAIGPVPEGTWGKEIWTQLWFRKLAKILLKTLLSNLCNSTEKDLICVTHIFL